MASLWQTGVTALALCAGLAAAALAVEPDPFGPLAPFRPGEALAARAATCATLPDWVGYAPETGERISLTVRGRLSAVESDGVLAYLVLCETADVQVLCVTYETGGFEPGDGAVLAGGFIRAEGRRVMLDPCLASDPRASAD
ncbi:hypothetical protein [uncultured Paracoccus sp.]|uniref:hypothetical protein n=1 Tax=uncultured Paracoccus sp. TaxID=189685 RepID=UPI00260E2D1F|nr:hypothetical protein [uncultured Paracoccus sp.]